MSQIRARQLPGRQEALRLAMGKADAPPLMRHIANLDKALQRQPPRPMPETFTASSGLDQLTAEERAALPF